MRRVNGFERDAPSCGRYVPALAAYRERDLAGRGYPPTAQRGQALDSSPTSPVTPRARGGWPLGVLVTCMVLAVLASGCGLGVMHAARPTPAGATDITAGMGLLTNDNMDEGPGALPIIQLEVRHGVTDRVDLGVRPFDTFGLVVDARVNMLDPDNAFALSATGGLGGSLDWGQGSNTALAHVGLFGEFQGTDAAVPYVGGMLTNYWFFGREQPATEMPGEVVEQAYHGDGVLALTAGLALWERAILVEYSYWTPVYNDPGDFFALIDNHVVSLVFTKRL